MKKHLTLMTLLSFLALTACKESGSSGVTESLVGDVNREVLPSNPSISPALDPLIASTHEYSARPMFLSNTTQRNLIGFEGSYTEYSGKHYFHQKASANSGAASCSIIWEIGITYDPLYNKDRISSLTKHCTPCANIYDRADDPNVHYTLNCSASNDYAVGQYMKIENLGGGVIKFSRYDLPTSLPFSFVLDKR